MPATNLSAFNAELKPSTELFLIDRKQVVPMPWAQWAAEIVNKGYAIVTITPSMQTDFREMQKLIDGVSISEKKKFSFVERTDGFYPVGYSYLKSVVNSDLCETFNYWKRYKAEHAAWDFSQTDFYARAESYEAQAARYGQHLIEAIGDHYGYAEKIDIGRDSYLQFNHYREELRASGRKYLQQRHEDGHLLTLIKPNGPGLVIYIDDTECLVDLGPDQAIVISGSLLTLLTEGDIEPTYHAVVNFTLPVARCSVVYNINVLASQLPGMRSGRNIEIFEPANAQHMQFGHNPLAQ
ncbi:hypothetical protein [Pseudomonas sp. LF245]